MTAATAPSAAPDADTAIITARDVTKVYKQGKVEVLALRGVDLDVGQGEFVVLAGPSGSGKSTLLNLIGALDHPTEGSILVAGREITHLSRSVAARFRLTSLGFVFQAYNLVPVLTCYENAEYTLALAGVPRTERRRLVVPLLERVGLGDMLTRKPHELSGGQQQRIAVVRAIASRPALVLADEPTANLDSETSGNLLDLMLELNAEHGTTFVFASHDPDLIARARRVVRLKDGRIDGDERR
ncbi:MAG: macrolide ABC transporter ATP-binding protein [Deltaproteobacteria bacterium HGW-Deltaproteobacteria-14]|jgi:putative ABC transport system ATP-binding protein|nr:MAG: macrolide ABC transporter ATP-binding protein [Deltaproteobacteria bacterium HGW-Deltaproteobacteria-14]